MWTKVPKSHRPTPETSHHERWRATAGNERQESAGPPHSSAVLPRDQLSFISSHPRGAQQQTSDGERGERSTEQEEKGSCGLRWDDSKAWAFPARGQPVLFILVWLVCSRAGCQHNLIFLSLTRGYVCATEEVLCGSQSTIVFILTPIRSLRATAAARPKTPKPYLIFQKKKKVGLCGGRPAD